MKKLFLLIISVLLSLNTKVFADDLGIFGGCKLSKTDIRKGNINIDNIPCFINNAITYFMGIAGTIAVIFIIIGAYQMLFGSLAKDNAKGKATITFAITGFILAAFSWAILRFIFDNFGA